MMRSILIEQAKYMYLNMCEIKDNNILLNEINFNKRTFSYYVNINAISYKNFSKIYGVI